VEVLSAAAHHGDPQTQESQIVTEKALRATVAGKDRIRSFLGSGRQDSDCVECHRGVGSTTGVPTLCVRLRATMPPEPRPLRGSLGASSTACSG
jgi:hypothetical protein